MTGIYEVRHSVQEFSIKVVSGIWEVVMYVLLKAEIMKQSAEISAGGETYMPSFTAIDSSIQVLLRFGFGNVNGYNVITEDTN